MVRLEFRREMANRQVIKEIHLAIQDMHVAESPALRFARTQKAAKISAAASLCPITHSKARRSAVLRFSPPSNSISAARSS
jgi:hypothetical protein